MKRRVVLKICAVLTGAATVVMVLVALGDSGHGTPPPVPEHSSMDMPSRPTVHQQPDGTWTSPLLPYAGPFASRSALEDALAQARRQGLIR